MRRGWVTSSPSGRQPLCYPSWKLPVYRDSAWHVHRHLSCCPRCNVSPVKLLGSSSTPVQCPPEPTHGLWVELSAKLFLRVPEPWWEAHQKFVLPTNSDNFQCDTGHRAAAKSWVLTGCPGLNYKFLRHSHKTGILHCLLPWPKLRFYLNSQYIFNDITSIMLKTWKITMF